MVYVNVILIVLNLLAIVSVSWYVYKLDARVLDHLSDAISQQIRLQDDRIEKRVSRAQGQSEDSEKTPQDNNSGVIGRPYRR